MQSFIDLNTTLTRSRPDERPMLFALVRGEDACDVPTRERLHAIGRERLTCALTGTFDEMLQQLKSKPARGRKRGYVIDVDELPEAKDANLVTLLDKLARIDAIAFVIIGSEWIEMCAATKAWERGTAWFDFTTVSAATGA
jgi:hypothetical protein